MLLGLPCILRLLLLLFMLSLSPGFLSLDLVPNVHPDNIVTSFIFADVLSETKNTTSHLLPVLCLEVGPELVVFKSFLQRGGHVPNLGLTLLEVDFPKLWASTGLIHGNKKVAVKVVKLIIDFLLR